MRSSLNSLGWLSMVLLFRLLLSWYVVCFCCYDIQKTDGALSPKLLLWVRIMLAVHHACHIAANDKHPLRAVLQAMTAES